MTTSSTFLQPVTENVNRIKHTNINLLIIFLFMGLPLSYVNNYTSYQKYGIKKALYLNRAIIMLASSSLNPMEGLVLHL